MKIYTKTGDKGETSLFTGKRVSKDNIRINAYGTVDELNSFIGLVQSKTEEKSLSEALSEVQNHLFNIGSDLASPFEDKPSKRLEKIPRISSNEVEQLENGIDRWNKSLRPLSNFILPGGSETSAILHCCRTICRRAEREITHLSSKEEINPIVLKYMNRLSDWLFTFARFVNYQMNVQEPEWETKNR